MVDKETILKALTNIIDWETGINIVALGLIYGIRIEDDKVNIIMTMTSTASTLKDTIIEEIDEQIQMLAHEPINVNVDIIFDPPWNPTMMDEKYRNRYMH